MWARPDTPEQAAGRAPATVGSPPNNLVCSLARAQGFSDVLQILEALASAEGNMERAAALLREGEIADMEQGYSNEHTQTCAPPHPAAAPARR